MLYTRVCQVSSTEVPLSHLQPFIKLCSSSSIFTIATSPIPRGLTLLLLPEHICGTNKNARRNNIQLHTPIHIYEHLLRYLFVYHSTINAQKCVLSKVQKSKERYKVHKRVNSSESTCIEEKKDNEK